MIVGSTKEHLSLEKRVSITPESAKNIIGYHLSKGEYFILLGQYDRALNELKFALSKVENNFQVTETIFSKMDEIKSLEKNS